MMLAEVWPKLRDPLLAIETGREEDVIRALENYAKPYAQDFVPGLASDILRVIHEQKFPERPKAQKKILRQESCILCSCGYKGPARNDACPRCRAAILLSLERLLGPGVP
jgi:hypothetical protein